MRFAAAACALAIVVCVAVFGAVLAQRATAPVVASAPPAKPAPAATPVGKQSPAQTVVATVPIAAPAAAPAVPQPAAAPAAPAPAAAAPINCPGNNNALGVSRVVEIDTTGGPGFGFEHFKQYDFLQANEVVLTFDDGPWPR